MKILVCGSRNWSDSVAIYAILRIVAQAYDGITVIHGDARGADRIAAKAAKRLGLQIKAFPADWDRYGKSAGPIRNQAMLEAKPKWVFAFTTRFPLTPGTRDMVTRAEAAGIKTTVVLGKEAGR